MSDDRVVGPMAAQMIEFSGLSYAEAFRHAADWFAAHDGEVRTIQGIAARILDARPRESEVWHVVTVFYDD